MTAACPAHPDRRIRFRDGVRLDRCPSCLAEARAAIETIESGVARATAWASSVLTRAYGPDWREALDERRREILARRRRLPTVS